MVWELMPASRKRLFEVKDDDIVSMSTSADVWVLIRSRTWEGIICWDADDDVLQWLALWFGHRAFQPVGVVVESTCSLSDFIVSASNATGFYEKYSLVSFILFFFLLFIFLYVYFVISLFCFLPFLFHLFYIRLISPGCSVNVYQMAFIAWWVEALL